MIYSYMDRDDFLSIDAIRFGWNGLWNNLRFFLILTIIMAVLYNLPSLIAAYVFNLEVKNGAISSQDFLMHLLLAVVSIIVYLTVELGLLRIALNFRDNNTAEFKDLFRGYPLLMKYLVGTMIFALIVILPFFFLSLAGALLLDQGTSKAIVFIIAFLILLAAAVYLFLKYQFYDYLIVDRGLGPIEALQQSGRLTEGILKNLLIFWLEIGLAIGVAIAMVSIFIEIPVTIVLMLISKDLAPMAGNLLSSAINLLIMVPITKLATADIYRRLERRSAAKALSDNSQMKGSGS
jgi:uncharacterized membrane protein